METLAVDMGYTPGVFALFYKVAIASGVAPLVVAGFLARFPAGPIMLIKYSSSGGELFQFVAGYS
ncbi:oxaloacetate decarboxylase subunit beta 1 [Escherichia fergusonii B253]|nr:oxaloacetate decarboxylase subunit beta 1 [Escherichia fergusonii B253]